MIKSTTRGWLLGGTLCVMSAVHTAVAQGKSPRVLVLNSYHPQYRWTERLLAGIKAGLGDTVAEEDLHVEYMDGRRFADDASYTGLLVPLYRTKYSRYPPDVIVSTDDIALDFLVGHGAELFPGVPVVFCGVNDFSPDRLAGRDEFTGILEGVEVRGNIDLILQVHPETRRIVILSDGTPMGTLMSRVARTVLAEHSDSSRAGQVELILWNDFTVTELMHRARSERPGTVFLMLAIVEDRQGEYFSFANDLKVLCDASAVPIYGMWGAGLFGRGVLGGLMNDPERHGRDAAGLARRILKGERASEIPIVPKARYEPAFDYQQMKRFGVALDRIPTDSRVLGRPVPFYSVRPWIAWTTAAVIAGLLLIVLFLLDHRRQLNRLREKDRDLREAGHRADEAGHRADKAEQLASVGTLIAGIAHDVGAPMTAILGYAEMMQKSLPDEKNRRRAAIIVEQVSRIQELIQALLNMTREDDRGSVAVDVAAVVDKSLDFYREMLHQRGITVQRSLATVPAISGNPDRLQQALLNLFVNAADAMRDGGELSVELSCPCTRVVEVRVSDSGVGIAPDLLQRVFEPFYTTKQRGQGTGLGLLVAKGIVEEHLGTIAVESSPGLGTTFTISLPVTEEQRKTSEPRPSRGLAQSG